MTTIAASFVFNSVAVAPATAAVHYAIVVVAVCHVTVQKREERTQSKWRRGGATQRPFCDDRSLQFVAAAVRGRRCYGAVLDGLRCS